MKSIHSRPLAVLTSFALVLGMFATAVPLASAAGPTTVTVTISKDIDGVPATATNANSADFPMAETTTVDGSTSSGNYDLNATDSYQAVTSNMDVAPAADYTTNEITGGSAVAASCTVGGQPFSLVGYTSGATLAAAQASTPSATPPSFTNMTQNEFVIVWNHNCSQPTVTAVSPTSGTTAGGTSVTITGTGFTGETAVDFGATLAASTTFVNDTTITATSPAGTAGTVDVTVTTPDGTSAVNSPADQFTYVTPTPATPIVSSVSPTSGTTAGGTSVTITGTGFTGETAVDFGATLAASTTFVNDTTITATSPAGTAGTVDVTVTTPDGTSAVNSPADQFTYVTPTPATPIVSSVSPTSGTTAGGTSVTITGTGFTSATAVDFGGVPATNFTASSTALNTSITATSPATTTAGIVDVTVTTPNGTNATSTADQFTYIAPILTAPNISGIGVTTNGTSSATISWMTDAAANSQVFYGTSASYGSSSTLNATATTTHSVILNNLAEATLYHFEVVSMDAGGTATSSDQVFTTGSTASSTPLALTGVTPVSTTATADGTFADGFQWVLHFVVPTNETSFQMKFSDFTTPTSSGTIPAANNILYFSPESSNATSSSSAITETNNGFGGALNLTGDTSTTTPGRQIDVTVEVAVPSGTPTGVYSTTFGALSHQ